MYQTIELELLWCNAKIIFIKGDNAWAPKTLLKKR